MAQLVKTVCGVAIASVKTVAGLAIASAKTIAGVDNTSGGGAMAATDSFDRANESPLAGNWSVLSGTLNLVGNAVVAVNTGFGTGQANIATYNAASASTTNQYGRVELLFAGGGNAYAGIVVCSGGSGQPLYGILASANDDQIAWNRLVSPTGAESWAVTQGVAVASNTNLACTKINTGTNTAVRVWAGITANPAPDAGGTTWDGLPPSHTFNNDPASEASGLSIGIFCAQATTLEVTFNNWSGGDVV